MLSKMRLGRRWTVNGTYFRFSNDPSDVELAGIPMSNNGIVRSPAPMADSEVRKLRYIFRKGPRTQPRFCCAVYVDG